MPQADQRLREKFMTDADLGVTRCEKIIEDAGGRVVRGLIFVNPDLIASNADLKDAINYLLDEWDYGI